MITRIPFNGDFRISQPFGNINHSLYGNKPHTGVDLVGITSIKVYGTMKNGVIKYVGYEKNGFGKYVKVTDLDTGNYHYYAHLKDVYVKKGDRVSFTTVIGLMGSTGNSTGPHTHYEIRKSDNKTRLNPCDYMGIPNKRGTYNASDYGIKTDEEIREEENKKQEELDEMKALEKCDELSKKITALENENKALKEALAGKLDKPKVRTEPRSWEKEAVDYCINQGLIKGDGDKVDLNRIVYLGDFAVFMYRILKHICKWFVKKQDCKNYNIDKE